VFKVEIWSGGYSEPNPNWWRASKEISGGQFYDWGAHFLDWLLGLLPGQKMESVYGSFHKLVWNEVSIEDHVEASIRFDSGCNVNIQMSQIAHAGKPRWFLLGTKGAIVDRGGYFEVTGDFESEGYKATLRVPYKGDSEWKTYYTNISEHLVQGKDLSVKPEQARRVIAVLEGAEVSSKQGHSIPVPTEDEDAKFVRND
jgi:predicted dehydrogenase